jgi:ligand-binding sensor domain-containing protein
MNMIEIKKTLFAVFICVMGHIVALAQKYQVRPLDLEQGLSCNYVLSIAQDKYGFLWFATEEGLNRFDGNSFFTYYKQRDRQGISSSELNCVIDDAKEPVVWIGTKNDGLNSFNYQTEEWHSYKHDGKNPSSIATNDITHITPSANGKLWITTYWKGVELFDPETKRFVHFDKNRVKGLPDNQLWCVLDLGNGNLLVGHVKSGLSIIDTQRLTARNFKHNDQDIFSISGNEVICLYRDKKGTIWIGTNVGIDIYDPLSQRFLHVADQTIKNHRIFDFCELPDGNMLVATEQMGIAVLDVANKSFTASTQISCSFISEGFSDFNLTGNSVRSLLLDKYNNVWAGFYGSGINFLTQSVAPFSTIRAGVPDQLERLTEKSVMGLAFDKKGQLWVGTDGKGLNVFSPERKRLATYEHEGGSIVTAATRDSYGNLWFGSFYQGATVKMAGGGFRKVLPNAHEDVRCFYEDDKQQMWIGTSHGIYVVDIKRMKVVNNYHLGNDMVRAICMDARHRVWVGYFDIGIEVFSPQMKRIKSFNSTKGEKEYIPSNAVNHLMRDSQGRIWAATNEGAICFDVKHQDRHVIYDQRQGMNNIHVRAIIEDEMHNIWMSTNRGISCLKAGQAGRFINFNEKDNVVKANFNDGSVARITHRDIHQMTFPAATTLHTDINITLIGIFDGIRYQIIQDNGDDLLVDIHQDWILWSHKPDGYVRLLRQFLVLQRNLMHGIHYVCLHYTKPTVVGLRLSEFQYLSNQFIQSHRTLMYHRQLMLHSLRNIRRMRDVVERTENQRKRSAEFMSDISKEAQALLVEFLFLLMVHLFCFQLEFQAEMTLICSQSQIHYHQNE